MQDPEHRALLTSGTYYYYCYDHSESGKGVVGGAQELWVRAKWRKEVRDCVPWTNL